ncbi:MAG: phosphoribosylglycinamide formyltransferase [Treponema sp.]|jgi:phosphoribosylglycinamide formyltransferase-1|nr:phosphoribosylglycinamide formyltransferase [Treponema sp.]
MNVVYGTAMIPMAVLVSGGGTNLQALIDAAEAGVLSWGKIALVISSTPQAYALKRAAQHRIPAVIVERNQYHDAAAYDRAMLHTLEAHRIRLVVLAGFLAILGTPVIQAYKKRIINIHPSLLPAFGGRGYYGLKVHEAVLAQGVKVTGATVHYVDERVDGGEIIVQKTVEVLEGDTPEVLQKRVMEQAEWLLLPAAVELVCKLDTT